MKLGSFSVSLSVKDLAASRDFCLERNILTFNPGWDQQGNDTDTFTDVREIQKKLKAAGISPASEADENSQGPASCMITDPDGNLILIDQHR